MCQPHAEQRHKSARHGVLQKHQNGQAAVHGQRKSQVQRGVYFTRGGAQVDWCAESHIQHRGSSMAQFVTARRHILQQRFEAEFAASRKLFAQAQNVFPNGVTHDLRPTWSHSHLY